MTIRPKNSTELDTMRAGGKILNQVLIDTYRFAKAGLSLKDLDKYVHHQIIRAGAKAAFLGYHGFPGSSCLSPNDVVVHGIPNSYVLKDGDILSVDIGVLYEGYYTDAAFTMGIGPISKDAKRLLDVTQASLREGIDAAINGNTISSIGDAVESYVKKQGKFGIVKDLSGHGIGQKLQEQPEILNIRNKNNTPIINNVTLAIEPMITLGTHQVTVDDDDWTVRTKDGSLSAHFETTVAVLDNDPEVLVDFPLVMHT